MKLDVELFACGVRGHATYRPDDTDLADQLHVQTAAGLTWRCLRCGTFVTGEPAASGPVQDAPVVARGAVLRDMVIMRLLALDRLLHAVVLLVAGLFILGLRHSQESIERAFERELPLLEPIAAQLGWTLAESRSVALIEKSLTLSPTVITWIGAAILVYAALHLVEAVGLWLMQRWGEYFSVVVTSAFVPMEIYELTERVTVLKLLVLAINVAAVVWLVWRKRLFGIRGGAVAYHAEHSAESLLTLESATRANAGAVRRE
ncbi:DUF2127 domain-containing protein [Gordonia caeni]|uniref:DUF2127 domain-containing protein n=1 Tax=Gordonia caeni TaxID=1007097 RepID=A0ABP7NUX6_9ACTN